MDGGKVIIYAGVRPGDGGIGGVIEEDDGQVGFKENEVRLATRENEFGGCILDAAGRVAGVFFQERPFALGRVTPAEGADDATFYFVEEFVTAFEWTDVLEIETGGGKRFAQPVGSAGPRIDIVGVIAREVNCFHISERRRLGKARRRCKEHANSWDANWWFSWSWD